MKITDMHCDTISRLLLRRRRGRPCQLSACDTQIDLERMRKSGYLLQNFAVFVNLAKTDDPLEEALHMIHLYYEQMEKNQDLISPVSTWQDICRNEAAGKISALLTLEEGGILKGEIDFLSVMHRLGVRMMTLTWNYENELGFPNVDAANAPDRRFSSSPSADRGLKEKGLLFLGEMERLGMIIDVSHLSDAGFYDVLEHTKKPFVASHSNARSVCPALRNLTDDMIRRLSERGGLAGLNFCRDFLGTPEDGSDYLRQAARHAKHLIRVGGEDFPALGSDFDGIPVYDDFRDCSVMPRLADCMEQEGLTYTQVEKIFSKNVLRLYRELL